jgi:beta-N-acetylhexosaminidase
MFLRPPRSHATRLRARALLVVRCLLVLGLIASGCAGDGDSATAVPTPEVESTTLLPPTPRTTEVAEAPTEAAPVEIAPAVTPTPRPPTLACVPQRTRYAQLLLPLATPGELGQARDMAAIGDLGGLGLLGSPGSSLADQLREIQNASFVPVLVASDEEGGSVQRLADLLGPLPSAASSATTRTPQDVQALWLEYGARVKELGIDVVFGPVVDVGGAPGIGSRSFGTEPVVVTAYGRAVTEGLLEAGITPVLKHFPGHGRASGDSHLGLPVVPTLDELWAVDLLPYADIVGDPKRDEVGVMIGHLSVPGFTGDLPTSLSADTINGLLRNEIGFGGIVFTDAMNMGAIVDSFGALDALERAFLAGADIAILGSLADVAPALDHLVARAALDPGLAGLLDERVARVMEAKGQTTICVGAQ